MKIRVNILSGTSGAKLDWVSGLSEAVPVFHTSLGVDHRVGSANGYEIEGEDLWATVDVEESCPPFLRAAGMLELGANGARLRAVILTTWSRQLLIDVMNRLGSPME